MQPTGIPTLATRDEQQPPTTEALLLQAQYIAGAVQLSLIDLAIITGLAAPHWETGRDGTLTGTLAGPDSFRQLDAWRRHIGGRAGFAIERRLHETRWTIATTVREIAVLLVAVGPASAATSTAVAA
jgi:hypothetical protein